MTPLDNDTDNDTLIPPSPSTLRRKDVLLAVLTRPRNYDKVTQLPRIYTRKPLRVRGKKFLFSQFSLKSFHVDYPNPKIRDVSVGQDGSARTSSMLSIVPFHPSTVPFHPSLKFRCVLLVIRDLYATVWLLIWSSGGPSCGRLLTGFRTCGNLHLVI